MLKSDEELRWFMQNIHTTAWNLELDRGAPWDETFDLQVARFPEWETVIRAYQTRWFDTMRDLIEENISLLRELHEKGKPVYAITNFPTVPFREIRKLYDFLNLFDGVIVSGEEGLIKPDAAIYQLLLSRYGLAAQDCIFIDDSAKNIAAAISVGMKAIHYAEPMDVRSELAKLGYQAD